MSWFRWWGKSRKNEAATEVNALDQMSAIDKRAALLTLSTKLSAGSENVVMEVMQALDHPEMYVEQWGDRLDNRGIHEPIPELAWFALVDALDDLGLVFEINWKLDAENILFAVHSLLDRRGWLLPAEDRRLEQAISLEGHTYQHLRELHQWLRPHGIVLGNLDINSDCYVLILVKEDDREEIEQLATNSGYQFHSSFQ
ncbi:hypothetical protein BRE01_59490 [Brevibacillus reuszeri]|uniref:DUF6630 domain-containing protein n=2 Tax=Brevibacillus reuszeri TaxID=54915 RepID=A0ABQ0TWE6_9BACL|nr:DUF6630 family protein [Brevibacillus reuszeri]MED1859257.1 hypothetical protein [Brevibacillus reuszeri]GED72247.1 hypothetical protein BRE01_59490 [Brevibacillus reuszeri]